MYRNGLWNLALAIIVITFFLGVGVANLVWPDYFLKKNWRSFKVGEMETDLNRIGTRLVGAMLAGGSTYILYQILTKFFSK